MYLDTILCSTFERRFEGKPMKFMDQPGDLNVLQIRIPFNFYFSPHDILLKKIFLASLLKYNSAE